MVKNCLYCEKELTGQQRKYCSYECSSAYLAEQYRAKNSKIELKRMKEEARWEWIKLNSSERAVIQIQKLMNK
jgi:hypothetical protein